MSDEHWNKTVEEISEGCREITANMIATRRHFEKLPYWIAGTFIAVIIILFVAVKILSWIYSP